MGVIAPHRKPSLEEEPDITFISSVGEKNQKTQCETLKVLILKIPHLSGGL